MDIPILTVELKSDQDLILARQRTKEVASLSGMSLQDQTRLITAVSELARNAFMYASGGKLRLSIINREGRQYVEAVISDTGKGIAKLKSIFDETYKSRTGLGKGIAGSRRIVDLFDIQSSEKGTTVVVAKVIPAVTPTINPKVVAGWTKGFSKPTSATTPIEQLQEQNQQLMQTLEELQQYKVELEHRLEQVNLLNRELDQKTHELAERSEQLQVASRHKGEFLANMSHEIRTPLNALLGLNNILARSDLDDEQRRLVSLSREAGKNLLALINDILDLSKIEAGKMPIETAEFAIKSMVTGIVDLFSLQAQEKGLELKLTIEEDVPPYVVGDEHRIRQVLINLLGNAIKFTEKGDIHLRVAAVKSEGELANIRFSVRDSGPGIAADLQKNLFQSFVQLDGSLTRQHGGTGLGLAICKHLIGLMNGDIGVDSKKGKGSTFWFELPMAIAPERVASPVEVVAGTANLSFLDALPGKTVLVAEDHPVNQLVASMELQEFGFEVHVANNGQEALDLISANSYMLVFMDCQMPVMDGFEASRRIREKGATLPIVAMTAHALEGDRERCLQAGMNDYISKPFETEDLRRVVTRWLKPKDEPAVSIDKEKLTARFKPAQIEKLIEAFLADLPASAAGIMDSLVSGDLEKAAATAHAFKSACSMVSALPLAAVVSEIETACRAGKSDALAALASRLEQYAKLTEQECLKILGPARSGAP